MDLGPAALAFGIIGAVGVVGLIAIGVIIIVILRKRHPGLLSDSREAAIQTNKSEKKEYSDVPRRRT